MLSYLPSFDSQWQSEDVEETQWQLDGCHTQSKSSIVGLQQQAHICTLMFILETLLSSRHLVIWLVTFTCCILICCKVCYTWCFTHRLWCSRPCGYHYCFVLVLVARVESLCADHRCWCVYNVWHVHVWNFIGTSLKDWCYPESNNNI